MGNVGKEIFVVSDSTGETADKVVRAALMQFPDRKAEVRIFPRVRDASALTSIVREAQQKKALVVTTLVRPELRQTFIELTTQLHVESVDVIGVALDKMGTFLAAEPLNIPTAEMPLSEEYFRRVEAIEFAVQSDDGRLPQSLQEADLVLVGVSRTSKTPLSTYLAGRGLKVANVPLVFGIEPPRQLFDLEPWKVVGLTVDIAELEKVRLQRLRHDGLPQDSEYATRPAIARELEFAHKLYRKNPGWIVINVTGRAIEETAALILQARAEAQRGGRDTIPPREMPG